MGRHLFSTVTAIKIGVITILGAENPPIQFNQKTYLRLNQHGKHAGMCSFDLSLPAVDRETLAKTAMSGVTKTSTPGEALAAQVIADNWHMRLDHMNPASMELLRKTEGNGVEYTGTVSGCDICAVGKRTQMAHPKNTTHKTDGPMELVYTDHMGPITPAAQGGYMYVSQFTDDVSRVNEIFLLKSKTEAVNTLHLYNMTVAVPLGLRIQRLRCDKGGEYISKEFKTLCVNSGISMEYTATATPQQKGISDGVGRTLAATVRCLLKDGNFSLNMWGELLFTSVYLTNRSPHATLGGRTPFFKMFDKGADLSALRAIGSRAFVHIETHTPKSSTTRLGKTHSVGSIRTAERIACTTLWNELWSKVATSLFWRHLHTRCHLWELTSRSMKFTITTSSILPSSWTSLFWTHKRRASSPNFTAFEKGLRECYKKTLTGKKQRLRRRKRRHHWKRNRHYLRRRNHHKILEPHQGSGLLKNQLYDLG